MKITRVWAMPNKNTFQIKPIKQKLEEIDEFMRGGVWIDPYSNNNKLADITNDLNPSFDTDYHLDALDFLKTFKDNSVQCVLFDPPYSPRQIKECYESVGLTTTQEDTQSSFWSKQKKELSRIVKKGGIVICFGWNSNGVGVKYGFEIEEIMLVAHGGNHNDTIMTICRKVS